MALSIIGTPAGAAAQTITLPTHAVGDIIVIAADRANGTQASVPAAGGTVPTWIDIDAPPGGGTVSLRSAYAVASSSSHTSGTWTNASAMVAIVIRGQAASAIGGHAEAYDSSATLSTAPAATLSQTNGSSIILEFHGASWAAGAWSAAPAGYTRQATATGTTAGLCLNTKNTTTADGSIAQAFTSGSGAAAGSIVEILALAAASLPTAPMLVRQAINRASRY